MLDSYLSAHEIEHSASVIGLDLGGTKCAVSHLVGGSVVEVLRLPTADFAHTFPTLLEAMLRLRGGNSAIVGVSCGGPLDSERGIIGTPPNLDKSWHGVPICQRLSEVLDAKVSLMNDANACALAEWKYGAGRGAQNMIFLTSGTGMGGGLILNGQLYEGATGDAGEIGHVRLCADGPIGYGKAGSVEGYCSGGGISRLAEQHLHKSRAQASEGRTYPLTTRFLAEEARRGDPLALAVMAEAGNRLGEALAILIDLFNPESIVLGGFFPLCRDLLEPTMSAALSREALPAPRMACQIRSAELGQTIGSHGAIAAALYRHPDFQNLATRK